MSGPWLNLRLDRDTVTLTNVDETLYEKTHSTCVLSRDLMYRYALARIWRELPLRVLAIIGLNPSTADHTRDDPTLRRCQHFARVHGYDGIVMLNLFAFRSTDPRALKVIKDPIGELNDDAITEVTADRDVLCAWGVHGDYRDRDLEVLARMNEQAVCPTGLLCLGTTSSGHPKHPLYLSNDTKLIPFTGTRR